MINLDAEEKDVNQIASRIDHFIERVAEEERYLARDTRLLERTQDAQEILQLIAQAVQQKAHERISKVVSSCLSTVFDEIRYEYVHRNKIPDPLVLGISEVSGRDGWVILAVDESSWMDEEENKSMRSSGSMPRGQSEELHGRAPRPSGFQRPLSDRQGDMPQSRSQREKQPSGKSPMGYPHLQHERSKASRKLESGYQIKQRKSSEDEELEEERSHSSISSKLGGSKYCDSKLRNPGKDMVRVRIKDKRAYEFQIKFERKRGRTEASLRFLRRGLDVDPLSASGGGMIDVAAFALRVACLMLHRPRLSRVVVIDEGFKFVSSQYRENVRSMLEGLAEDLGIQIVQVTHIEELETGKVIEL